jgi:hypothetical protein
MEGSMKTLYFVMWCCVVWLESTSISKELVIYVFSVPTLKIEAACFSETYDISSRLHDVPEDSTFMGRKRLSRNSPPSFWIVYFEDGGITFIPNVYISLHGVTSEETVVLKYINLKKMVLLFQFAISFWLRCMVPLEELHLLEYNAL